MDWWENQIKELIETRTDFVILLDQNGLILLVNHQWMDYCIQNSLPNAYWKTGTDYLKFLEEAGKTEEVQCLKDVLENALDRQIPLVPLHTPEETKWVSIKARQFTFMDKTKGAIIYQKLAQINSIGLETEQVIESMKVALCIFDSEMRFTFANTMTEELLGMKSNELVGKDLRAIFLEPNECSFYIACFEAKEQQQPMQLRFYSETFKLWTDVKVEPIKEGGVAVFFQDISEQKIIESQLKKYDYFDPLTRLPTRKRVKEEMEWLIETKSHFSLLYLNLNKLKYVNSLYTHQVGDELLKQVADCIQTLLNESDIFGRLDGDEFVIIRQLQEHEDDSHLPSAISQLFNKPFPLEGIKPINISASIGVVVCSRDSTRVNELLEFGETAMHVAKKQGDSSYAVFHPSMNIVAARRRIIEQGLAGDLKDLGIYFALQPQVDAASGKLCGVEVLARWNHPELGMISPEEFIKVAEETGTIATLTYYLVHEIFSYMKERERKYGCFLRTAINVTPSLLTNKDFFDSFFLLLKQYEIPPEMIEFEITESIELTHSEVTLQNLLLCRSKGITVALDDFGTGFSMISYLTQFPIDKIKLDKYFTRNLEGGGKSEDVLKSLIHFVHSIGCNLVAEGIETKRGS